MGRITAVALVVAISPVALAETRNWDAEGGTLNPSWSSAINWDPNVLPRFDGTEDILLRAANSSGAYLGADRSVRSLVMQWGINQKISSGYALTLTSGYLGRQNAHYGNDTGQWQIGANIILGADGVFRNDIDSTSSNDRGVTYQIAITGGIGQNGGSFGLTKVGFGGLELSGANTFTGPVRVQNGNLRLRGTAANPYDTVIAQGGGTDFIYDAASANLLADSGDLVLSGGEVRFTGYAQSTTTERVGRLIADGACGSMIIRSNDYYGDQIPRPFVLQASQIVRQNHGTVMITSESSYGDLGKPGAQTARVIADTAPTMVGGGGTPGTRSISIVPWIVGNVSGPSLMTYDSTVGTDGRAIGLRALTSSEYVTQVASGSITQDNVYIYNAGSTLTAPATINALSLRKSALGGSSSVLKITSGLVNAGADGGSVSVGRIDFGNVEGMLISQDIQCTLLIDSPISGTAGVTVAGPGIVSPDQALRLLGWNVSDGAARDCQ